MCVMEFTERPIKIETIRRSIIECSNVSLPAIKERIIAQCGKWWGTSRRTALEYLTELHNSQQIFIDGEEIWSIDRWEKIKDAQELDFMKGCDIIQKTFKECNGLSNTGEEE